MVFADSLSEVTITQAAARACVRVRCLPFSEHGNGNSQNPTAFSISQGTDGRWHTRYGTTLLRRQGSPQPNFASLDQALDLCRQRCIELGRLLLEGSS
jgi:hypothetical protein